MKELKEIYSPFTKIKLAETEVKVTAFKVKDFPRVLNIIGKGIETIFSQKDESQMDLAKRLFDFLSKDIDLAYELIEISTDLKKEFLEELSLEAVSFIISEIVEVNHDFLFGKVAPQFQGLMQKVKNKKSPIGTNKSKG